MSLRFLRVAGAVAVVLVVFAGIASAHGSFTVALKSKQDNTVAQGVPESYTVGIMTVDNDLVPPKYGNDSFDVTLNVSIDGERVEQKRFEMGYLDRKIVTVNVTAREPGNATVAVNATYELGGGEWSVQRNDSTTVDVVPAGSPAALEECKNKSSRKVLGSGGLQCHVGQQGIVGGLVPGMMASPAFAALLLLVVGGLGGVGLRTAGVDVLG